MPLIDNAFIAEVGALRWFQRTLHRQLYKRLLRKDQFMRLPTGGLFRLPRTSRFATEVFVTQADVDWGSEALLYSMLDRGGAFLDVGANIGYYSLYMAPRVDSVYAFEPDPRMFELLKVSFAGDKVISAIPVAVSNRVGKAPFVVEAEGEVSHLLGDETGDRTTIEVDVVTLDAFCTERGIKVSGVKVDVEGFDLDVLQGAVKLLLSDRPIVLSEVSLTQSILDFAKDVDYQIMAFVRDRKTRKKVFTRLSDLLPATVTAKMLFLVPAERSARLMDIALTSANRMQ